MNEMTATITHGIDGLRTKEKTASGARHATCKHVSGVPYHLPRTPIIILKDIGKENVVFNKTHTVRAEISHVLTKNERGHERSLLAG